MMINPIAASAVAAQHAVQGSSSSQFHQLKLQTRWPTAPAICFCSF